jgi:hypothetical protein
LCAVEHDDIEMAFCFASEVLRRRQSGESAANNDHVLS